MCGVPPSVTAVSLPLYGVYDLGVFFSDATRSKGITAGFTSFLEPNVNTPIEFGIHTAQGTCSSFIIHKTESNSCNTVEVYCIHTYTSSLVHFYILCTMLSTFEEWMTLAATSYNNNTVWSLESAGTVCILSNVHGLTCLIVLLLLSLTAGLGDRNTTSPTCQLHSNRDSCWHTYKQTGNLSPVNYYSFGYYCECIATDISQHQCHLQRLLS